MVKLKKDIKESLAKKWLSIPMCIGIIILGSSCLNLKEFFPEILKDWGYSRIVQKMVKLPVLLGFFSAVIPGYYFQAVRQESGILDSCSGDFDRIHTARSHNQVHKWRSRMGLNDFYSIGSDECMKYFRSIHHDKHNCNELPKDYKHALAYSLSSILKCCS